MGSQWQYGNNRRFSRKGKMLNTPSDRHTDIHSTEASYNKLLVSLKYQHTMALDNFMYHKTGNRYDMGESSKFPKS